MRPRCNQHQTDKAVWLTAVTTHTREMQLQTTGEGGFANGGDDAYARDATVLLRPSRGQGGSDRIRRRPPPQAVLPLRPFFLPTLAQQRPGRNASARTDMSRFLVRGRAAAERGQNRVKIAQVSTLNGAWR